MSKYNITTLPQEDAERLNTYSPREDWNLYFWGFSCFSRQCYAKAVPLYGADEIMLSIQCVEGGRLGKLTIRWIILGGKSFLRLEVLNHAWPLLQTPTFAAVLDEMTNL